MAFISFFKKELKMSDVSLRVTGSHLTHFLFDAITCERVQSDVIISCIH